MKKLIAIMLAAVMCLSVLPFAAMAADSLKVYAYVPDNWENPCVWAWDDNQKNAFEAWPGQAMTKGDDGWWYAEVPAWVQNVLISANGGTVQTADLDMEQTGDMWIPVVSAGGGNSAKIYYEKPNLDDALAPPATPTDFYLVGYLNNADYGIVADIDNMGDYKFVDGKVTVNLTADSYVQVKDNNKSIYGTAAYSTDKSASMAIGGGEKMFVPAGNITFTLVVNADGSVTLSYEGGSEGGNNQQGTSGNPAPADGVYIVAGTAGLCGAEWSTTEIANTMEKNADGTYSITFTGVASGNHEFKVTDGTWDNAWPNDNYKFGVVAACDVTVTFNPADGSVSVTGVNVTGPIEGGNQGGSEGGNQGGSSAPADGTYVIAGVGALCGTDWDTTNTMNTMIKNANGTYTFTYPDVSKGNYEFKVTDGTWNNCWPGENYKFGVSDTCDVTITFNPADCSITVTGDKVGEPSADYAGSDATGTIKVYAYVPDSWDSPCVWAWDDNQKNAFEAWPGQAMTKGDDGWWYAEVPAWVQNVIINGNNGAAQTADLDMPESADMWIPVTIANGTVQAEIYYSEPDVDDLNQPTTAPTTPPTTAPVVDDNGNGGGGDVVVTVIVSALLIVGSGVAGFFVTKAIIAKKNAQPETEETEAESEAETEETAE